jgi:4-hydroxybenzoate polyprenyltransferase
MKKHTDYGFVVREILRSLVWPAAAAVSLAIAVGGRDVTGLGLLLIACGTMAAYGLDRIIDNRGSDPPHLRRVIIICVGMVSLVGAMLACTAWWRFKVCSVLGLVAAAYIPLKRYIPKNVMTVICWTGAVATLPFAGQPPLDPTFAASVATVAMIMAANTILCDIPDVAADRHNRVRSLTAKFGAYGGAIAAASFGVMGAIIGGSAGRWGLAATALCLAMLAVPMARNPTYRRRLMADAIVTVLPGPLTILFRLPALPIN